MCIQQVREITGVNDEILLLNLFSEQNVESQKVLTERVLSATDLANHVPETVGHIYPVMQGDSVAMDYTGSKDDDWLDEEHKMYIPYMMDSENSNKI